MVSHPSDPNHKPPQGQPGASAKGGAKSGERVARVLARAGVASRREAERLIESGRVALNGVVLTSPALNVGAGDILTVDGQPIAERTRARLWRYHKPPGLITTHKDPKGRPTVFERLPRELGRVISVGRLDLSSEGLLLLTNDGDLARSLELPATGLKRRYRARAFGRVSQEKLDRLKDGLVVEGVAYGPIEAELERGSGSNVWIRVSITEGKNREVRRVLEHLGLKVNRLIRVSYGPFELGELEAGGVQEVPARQVHRLLKGDFETSEKPLRPGPPARQTERPPGRPRAKPPHGKPFTPRARQDAEPGRPAFRGRSAMAAKPKAQDKTWTRTRRPPQDAEGADKPKTYKTGWARPKPRTGPRTAKPAGSRGPRK
jgi:23S rRNA pseudouridine2605 synthase